MVSAAPMALAFPTLFMLDYMSLYSVGWIILGYGIIFTSSYMLGQRMQMPLWHSRMLIRWSVLAIFTSLLLWYCILSRDMQMSDARRIMTNMQLELDKDGTKFYQQTGSATAKGRELLAEQRRKEAELQRLKDPFM